MTHPARAHRADASTAPSSARIDANRANAARSTGPRTPAGLAVSRANATTHGLTARSIVLRGESSEAWEVFRAAAMADLAPVGFVEVQFAERAAELLWRLRRAGAAEAAVAAFSDADAEREAFRDAIEAAPSHHRRYLREQTPTFEAFKRCDARIVDLDAAFTRSIEEHTPRETVPANDQGVLYMARLLVEAAGEPEWAPFNNFEAEGDRSVGALRDFAEEYATLAGAPDPDGGAVRLLRKARRTLLERRLAALEVLQHAKRRAELARALAAVGERAEPVRRHEAHLQRQLSATLAALDAARARRRG